MAITISSLYPAKNDVGIPVDANIELRIESDGAELNVSDLKFYINDIEVKPFYRYVGSPGSEDKTKIDLTFFSRRRIKYGNERYGAVDTRYGKLDNYPSSFLYGLRYVCKLVVTDVDGLEFKDHFSFTIEEGIFYNQTPEDYFYSSNTQQLANYLPDWTKARYDKFSNFQQIVNPAGLILEEIDNKIQNDFSNYFVQTANYNELSTLYKAEIGSNYNFQTTILDDGSSLQIPPDVSARLDISILYPQAEFANNLKSFYQYKLPTRLESSKTILASNVFLNTFDVTLDKITVNSELARNGTLCFKMQNASSYSKIDPISQDVLVTVIRIVGTSPQGVNQEEDITVIDNDNYISKKRWSFVESLQFINIPDNSGATCTVQYMPDADSFVSDTFRFTSVEDSTQNVFWKLGETAYGSTLEQHVFLANNIDDLLASLGEKNLVTEYELLDIDNQTNLNLIAIAADTFSNYLYGVDEEHLYIFDKREPYTTVLEHLPRNPGDPEFTLDLATDNLGRGDTSKTIEIAGIQKLINKTITKYRFGIRLPDGSYRYVLQDGSLTTDSRLATVAVPRNTDQLITKIINVDLPYLGDYVIYAEASYDDGSVSNDAKIARVLAKPALAKYKLERLLIDAIPENIVRDFDGKIKILDTNHYLHSIYLSKDNMLVDYEANTLYFNEQYNEIEIHD